MGHKKVSNEPYYPEEIRVGHRCSGCEQLQTDLDTAKAENVDFQAGINCGADRYNKLYDETKRLWDEIRGQKQWQNCPSCKKVFATQF